MERMAAMGVPAGGGRNELDCRLCDELDHVHLFRERLRPPSWKGASGNGSTDDSAGAAWLCGDADLLVHPGLDVPRCDLLWYLRVWPSAVRKAFLGVVVKASAAGS